MYKKEFYKIVKEASWEIYDPNTLKDVAVALYFATYFNINMYREGVDLCDATSSDLFDKNLTDMEFFS